jgi:hypothetical protein
MIIRVGLGLCGLSWLGRGNPSALRQRTPARPEVQVGTDRWAVRGAPGGRALPPKPRLKPTTYSQCLPQAEKGSM